VVILASWLSVGACLDEAAQFRLAYRVTMTKSTAPRDGVAQHGMTRIAIVLALTIG